MEKETKLQILEAAMDLACQRLAEMKKEDMGSETLSRLLSNLSSLRYESESLLYRPFPVASGTNTGVPVEAPCAPATEAPAPAAEPQEENGGSTGMTLVEVRTILSDLAGRTRIDLPALLAQFGAAKLSAVDPAQYPALVSAAKAAARRA